MTSSDQASPSNVYHAESENFSLQKGVDVPSCSSFSTAEVHLLPNLKEEGSETLLIQLKKVFFITNYPSSTPTVLNQSSS